MKLLLALLPLLLASVTSLPLPEEMVAVEKEITSAVKTDENPIVINDAMKIEKKSDSSTEKSEEKKVVEDIKSTNNPEKISQKVEPKTIDIDTKDTKENKVVIIEAKSVVNKEPEVEKKTEKNEEKLQTPVEVKETTTTLITETTIKPIPVKKSESDVIDVKTKIQENMESNESNEKKTENKSKEDTISSESKESVESQENKS